MLRCRLEPLSRASNRPKATDERWHRVLKHAPDFTGDIREVRIALVFADDLEANILTGIGECRHGCEGGTARNLLFMIDVLASCNMIDGQQWGQQPWRDPAILPGEV